MKPKGTQYNLVVYLHSESKQAVHKYVGNKYWYLYARRTIWGATSYVWITLAGEVEFPKHVAFVGHLDVEILPGGDGGGYLDMIPSIQILAKN
jgi:hypothetical protein